jgi:hypothetical protein
VVGIMGLPKATWPAMTPATVTVPSGTES